jgi:hypothetical protein
MATDQHEAARGALTYLRVEEAGDEAFLPRTPVLQAFRGRIRELN